MLLCFLGFDLVESLTCYRAFVSLTATAPDSTKLFRRRTKQRERKINLVTGPTQCKPYTSIHQKPPAYPPLAYPLIWTASTCRCEQKKGEISSGFSVYLSLIESAKLRPYVLPPKETFHQVYRNARFCRPHRQFMLTLAVACKGAKGASAGELARVHEQWIYTRNVASSEKVIAPWYAPERSRVTTPRCEPLFRRKPLSHTSITISNHAPQHPSYIAMFLLLRPSSIRQCSCTHRVNAASTGREINSAVETNLTRSATCSRFYSIKRPTSRRRDFP